MSEVPKSSTEIRKVPSKSELLTRTSREVGLYRNKNIEVLLSKLETGTLDNFDGELVKLLEATLKEGNYKKTLLAVVVPYFERLTGAVAPTITGIWGGFRIADAGKEFADSYVKEDVVNKGRRLLDFLMLNETGLFDVEGDDWIETLQGWFNEVKIWLAERTNKVVRQFGGALVEGMASSVGFTAGWISYPFAAVGGYLGTSFLVGGGIGVAREMKKSSGFEQIAEYVERSERMVNEDVRSEDGTDPRHDLIVLHGRIAEDPNRLGHKLKNEDWLRLSAAVRNARVSILREKTQVPEIIMSKEVRDVLGRQAELIDRLVESGGEIANEDLVMATEIISQYDGALDRDTSAVERRFINYNSAYAKTIRYSQAFVREGIRGTGIPLVVKTVGKLLNISSRLGVPGTGILRRNKK